MRGIFFILMPAWLYSYTYTVTTYVLTKYICNFYESTEVWKRRNISRKKYLIGSNQFWSEISPVFRGLTSWHIYEALIKSRHCEKATKFEKISHLFWRNSCFYPVVSKQVGDFFQILWSFQKSWTLTEKAHSRTYVQWIWWYQFIMTAPMKSNEFVLKKLQFFLHDFHSIKCQCHAELFLSIGLI